MKLGIVGMFLLLLIILISGSFFGNIIREGMSSSERISGIKNLTIAANPVGNNHGVIGNTDYDTNVDPNAIYNYLSQRGQLRIDQDQGNKQVGNRIPQNYLDSGFNNNNTFSGDGGYGGGDSFDYSDTPTASAQSALPKGIPKSQIPPGKEHMYIAKSQVVAPICPECPPVISECKKPCPECPECAACPDQPIRCKKVPNYSSNDPKFIPRAVLTNFSTFGM